MKFAYQPEARPLDGYTIKRAIHRGGFGEVYYALTDSGKEVALKLLHDNAEIEMRGVAQCMNIKHPQLVTIFDIKQDADGDSWIIMEYIAGKTLGEVLADAPRGMPMEDVLRWVEGIAQGVGYLHEHGIVHRDLKPANIFIENQAVKVADVGLSKFITPSRRSAQTQSVGTVYYMAPEVAHGRYGKEVDLYALGVITYEMITGTVPFEGQSAGEIMMKHLTQLPELSVIPAHIRPLLARALEKDPAKRVLEIREYARLFRLAVRTMEVPVLPDPTVDSHVLADQISDAESKPAPQVVSDKGTHQPVNEPVHWMEYMFPGWGHKFCSDKKFQKKMLYGKMWPAKKTDDAEPSPKQQVKSEPYVVPLQEHFHPHQNHHSKDTSGEQQYQSYAERFKHDSAFKWFVILSGIALLIMFRLGLLGTMEATAASGSRILQYRMMPWWFVIAVFCVAIRYGYYFMRDQQLDEQATVAQIPPAPRPVLETQPHPSSMLERRKQRYALIRKNWLAETAFSNMYVTLVVILLTGGLGYFVPEFFARSKTWSPEHTRAAVFFVTTVVCSAWGLIVLNKMREVYRTSSRQFEWMYPTLGIVMAALSSLLLSLLQVQDTLKASPFFNSSPAFRYVGPYLTQVDHLPTPLGFALFFVCLFSIVTWSRMTNRYRLYRLTMFKIAEATIWGFVLSCFFFPGGWGVTYAAVLAVTLQLTSTWVEQPES
jgi:serine/threonine protein kinase